MAQNKKVIIINASAAKTGGAETILRTFNEHIEKVTSHDFVVLSPISFQSTCKHIRYLNVKTNSFQTIFFTVWGVRKYIKRFKPIKVISFNNINHILNSATGITYFHQTKALDKSYSDVKLRIYRIMISTFLRKNVFIVQSEYIRNKFMKSFRIGHTQICSCWPGFTIPSLAAVSLNLKKRSYSFNGLLPIAYATNHKNVELVRELIGFFVNKRVHLTTLLDHPNDIFEADCNNIESIGLISRDKMFELYQEMDFLIFTSKDETVGLPIFEFLQTGKPAYVFAADYAVAFYEQFDKPINFILFKDAEDFERLFLENINVRAPFYDYSKGEWNKIIDLL